ncbi:FkbM family methyltransferase [Cognataquiflexum rubidum]|uniref:FkbM family methyltransferase n=1 Tax=Cognataquiflexum rubidum TaxID=2922273 RepID=UPI001F1446F6|nr:FkbM family methyltransferase [Cognataquiflexum rubidum]MCH6234043.1 FkbM family methyltransferase [Cognataquiflexum rubidum]
MMMKDTFNLPWLVRLQRSYEYPKKYGIMDKLFGKTISKNGITWVKLLNGLLWKLDLNLAVHRWMIYGVYDAAFINWVKKNATDKDVIIDSGANIGQSTAYFSKIAFNGKILAFEPDDVAHSWVIESVEKNKLDNVEVIFKGLGSVSKTAYLEVPENGKKLGLHAYWSVVNDISGKEICISTLDQELNIRGINNVFLWKLDVEGYEIPALEGARTLLENKQIKALYIELTTKDDNNKKIINYMSKLGYQLFYLNNKGNASQSNQIYSYKTDGLFMPKTIK